MSDYLVRRAVQVIRDNNKVTVVLSQAEAVALLDHVEALTAERDAAREEADQLRENIRHLRREWYLRDLQGIDFAAAIH